MMEDKVPMMDAGMRLFETEKPFGTVLGGIKVEMAKHGKILTSENSGYDLLLDRSTKYKKKYISCLLEDAGVVGKTADGEEIHRYSASLKEGNKNTNVGIYVAASLVIIWAMLGWLVSNGNTLLTIVFTAVGIFGAWRLIRPSKDNPRLVNQLMDIFAEGK
ncbi:MAG: hypothetical protein J6Y06_05470 [Bacteroidales bacterium]|nr:hypothetical protein [Bacteroidales bacterium]